MAKELIARGQITITTQSDAYTISASRNSFIIATDKQGKIHTAVSTTTVISVLKGSTAITPTIGVLPTIPGCSLSKSGTTVTIIFNIGTSLAENGIIDIPVVIDSKNFTVSFSYAKARTGADGATGAAGTDANLLDWVKEWNTNKTVIGSETVITPKIFAGTKNSNGTLTGVAIGKFVLSSINASGSVATETVNGIYGFKDGYKTFYLDSAGNAQLGRANQFIKYNSATGKIEFGSEVSLNWTTAANNALSSAKTYADTKKTEAISAAATDATNKVNALQIGGSNLLNNSSGWRAAGWNNGITTNGGGYTIDSSVLYQGNPTLKTLVGSGLSHPWIKLENGIEYTYSAMVFCNENIAGSGSVPLHYHAGLSNTNQGKITIVKSDTTVVAGKWKKIFITFKLTGDADSFRPFFYRGSNGTTTYWLHYIKLEKGNVATDWTPSTADVAASILDAKKAGTDAKTVADAITQKAADQKWDTKLTYIDSTGIFTGTLSANTINAVKINASQITTGTIDAARINVDALKTALITAGNIEALTLNVVRGKIGGWSIDSDSIFRGTKNNTIEAFTAASGAVTIGSTGIRGFKWRLDATGAGSLAGGNIKWDAAGTVTFGASVSLNWTKYDYLGTYINVSGIYTGTLTANQVNAVSINADSIKAGMLSADRIAAGSITAAKLNVASVQASVVTAAVVNALTCTFVRGTVGGLTIASNSIYHALNSRHFIIKSTDGDSPLGSNRGHRGISMYNDDTAVADGKVKIVQIGALADKNTTQTYTSETNYGFRIAIKGGQDIFRVDQSGAGIANWNFDTDSIYRGTKNNISGGYTAVSGAITIGSNGIRGYKWRLDSTGAGAIAGGNISWDATGTVTFSSAVSLNWKNDIENAKTVNYGYRYYKRIVINGEENKYYPVIIKGGEQSVKRNIMVRRAYSEQAPASWHNSTHMGGLILHIKTNFGGWGGSTYSWDIYELSETYCSMFAGAAHLGNMMHFGIFLRGGGTNGAVYHVYSDQSLESQTYSPTPYPVAPQICYNQEVYWVNGATELKAPAPRTRSAADIEEIRRRRFIVLSQERDTYLTSHPLTYIGSTGIYTGTLTANQVNAVSINADSIQAGTLSVDRIAAGSITGAKLNVASVQASIVTATAVNGLTCTFVRGKIGNWNIAADNISTGSLGAAGQTPIQLRPTSAGSGYWYTGAYKPMGLAITWHQNSNAGHIVFGQIAASGSTVKTGFVGIQMMAWDNTEYFCLSTNYTKSGAKEVYNRIAGWAFDNTRIWKNSVSLGADGSIQNGNYWQMNNDGSGRLAGGNIVWNAAGTVTFSAAVALNWQNDATNKANDAKELAMAMAFGRMLYRDPAFKNGSNSINIYNNSGNGMVAHARISDSTAPNDTKVVIQIKNIGASSPGCGGFYFGTTTSYRKIFITRIIAKIPSGRNLCWATNSIGTGGTHKWLTPVAGTGDWCEYICKVRCGTASFSSTHFFYLDGAVGTSVAPVEWRVAYATVFDVTSTENYTTTIGADGIYTGSIRAGQILVDSALVVGGSSYNGSISVRDASNVVKVTLDRTGITAIGGTIGGWVIASSQISKNGIVLGADGSITNGTKWMLNYNGSGQLANGNITWDLNGNLTMRGRIEASSGTIGGFEIGSGRIGSTASGTGSGGGLAIYNDLFRVGSTISYALFGDDTFPATAGGAFKATGRLTNTRYDSYYTNIGLYTDVKSARRNFGVYSNAALLAPFMITNKVKILAFGSGSYSIDFAQHNLFYIYATTSVNVTLPSESSVCEMFGLSYLPSDFACVFTFIYNYNWSNRVTLLNLRNNNGGTSNYAMEKGDSVVIVCGKYPSFHYQVISHYH